MAKFYEDLPCVNTGGLVHISVSGNKFLCGRDCNYDQPFSDKRTNLIWRTIDVVSCPECRSLFSATLANENLLIIHVPEENVHCGFSGKIFIDETVPEL